MLKMEAVARVVFFGALQEVKGVLKEIALQPESHRI